VFIALDKDPIKMKKPAYEKQLVQLQSELVALQTWVQSTGSKVVVVFEGRDAAGKGGAIKAITARLNPRVVKIAALTRPTEREKTQWYFQRYTAHLPSAGEIVLFDRSWYNRAGVEKVMGFCSKEEHQDFLLACPEYENMLIRSGITLIKYWFSVSDEEQENRFVERISNPLKHWKFSDIDLVSRAKWVEYSRAKDEMFAHTDTDVSPWFVVDGDDKRAARLNCIHHFLSQIEYQHLKQSKIELPVLDKKKYKRPPHKHQHHIPLKFS
jgi:polyphosphate kinase 2